MALTLPDDPAVRRYFADEAEIRFVYWRPAAGDVVLDIGCALGSYAIDAIAAGATVYAVDPDGQALDTLDRICMDNGFKAWTVEQCSVGEPWAPERLAEVPEHLRPSGRWHTLDALAGEWGITRCDWVKIDVEGGELSVLRGAADLLRRFRPRMVIEDHSGVYPTATREADTVWQLLLDADYAVTHVPYVGVDGPRAYWICDA